MRALAIVLSFVEIQDTERVVSSARVITCFASGHTLDTNSGTLDWGKIGLMFCSSSTKVPGTGGSDIETVGEAWTVLDGSDGVFLSRLAMEKLLMSLLFPLSSCRSW